MTDLIESISSKRFRVAQIRKSSIQMFDVNGGPCRWCAIEDFSTSEEREAFYFPPGRPLIGCFVKVLEYFHTTIPGWQKSRRRETYIYDSITVEEAMTRVAV